MMWPWRRERGGPLEWRGAGPEGEVPPGYRLRRVGPGEWVAEPTRRFLWAGVIAVAAFATGGITGALMARSYYHRTATVILMTINGTPYRKDDLRNRLESRYGVEEVTRFATYELSRQFAEARSCWPTDEELNRRLRREQARSDFLERLQISGLTEEDYKEDLRLDMAQTKLLIRGVTVTPGEVWAFYRSNADPANPAGRYHTPDRIQVTAIGTATEDAARQALRELAADIPWRVVVARYSEHESRRANGLMPPFSRGESIFATNPETEAAVFAMRPGDRIGPLPAARHWWIVRCENRWRATTESWNEAREDARIGAMLVKGIVQNRQKLEKEREEFVRRSSIIILDPAYGEAQGAVLSRPIRW